MPKQEALSKWTLGFHVLYPVLIIGSWFAPPFSGIGVVYMGLIALAAVVGDVKALKHQAGRRAQQTWIDIGVFGVGFLSILVHALIG
ncbi:hypothetical protein [Lacticaseibacillus absianus]|uniref:hypothetical protein n=1 Tax=Lacticaseibacillus absianus TaxID=2729623 RepID=UPI0015CD4CF9|nr:hypothetical protein [Lacticaseibacillus absianus]